MDPAERLALPVKWHPVHVVNVGQPLADTLGPAHGQDGATDWWGFHFPCGLEVLVHASSRFPMASINADRHEVEHVIRHLGLANRVIWRAEATRPAPWRVMRQDDAGVRYVLADVATEREARCLAARYEARGHKQTYWAEPR